MGQQQLLLIVLGVILVGIAVAFGINLFRANAVDAKRNNVIEECVNLASMAQQYYMRPAAFGGGGRSFENWKVPTQLSSTENGSFKAETEGENVIIIGTGNEVVTGNDSVKVKMTVSAHNYVTEIIN